AAEGGTIGLVRDGDTIEIDIPNRTIRLAVSDPELGSRRAEHDRLGWKPAAPRKRRVTTALKAYAMTATSAAKGAVGQLPDAAGHWRRPAAVPAGVAAGVTAARRARSRHPGRTSGPLHGQYCVRHRHPPKGTADRGGYRGSGPAWRAASPERCALS